MQETRDVLVGKRAPHHAASGTRVVENPVTRERLTLLATTKDTRGEFTKFTNEEVPAGALAVTIRNHSCPRVTLWLAE